MFIKQRVIGKCVHSPHIPKQTAIVSRKSDSCFDAWFYLLGPFTM